MVITFRNEYIISAGYKLPSNRSFIISQRLYTDSWPIPSMQLHNHNLLRLWRASVRLISKIPGDQARIAI